MVGNLGTSYDNFSNDVVIGVDGFKVCNMIYLRMSLCLSHRKRDCGQKCTCFSMFFCDSQIFTKSSKLSNCFRFLSAQYLSPLSQPPALRYRYDGIKSVPWIAHKSEFKVLIELFSTVDNSEIEGSVVVRKIAK